MTNKPVIEDVIISKEKQEALNKILNSRLSPKSKQQAMKYITGGECHICGKVPEKRVKYDVSDEDGEGYIIERYCLEHFNKVKDSL